MKATLPFVIGFLFNCFSGEAFTATSSLREIGVRSPTSVVVTTMGFPREAKSASSIMKAGSPVLEPPPSIVETDVEEVTKKQNANSEASGYTKKGGWAVRLFNDPMNKREFVSMCLAKICGLSDGQAYQVMMAAHQNGLAVIGRYDFERAELYRDSLVEHGLVCDMIPVEED